MTVTIEKLQNNEVQLNIEIGPAVSSLEYDKACRKLSQRVNIPGFRQGNAPNKLLEKYVGLAAIQREVLDSILPPLFESAINENNFELVAAPSIENYEFASDKSLKVVAKFELKPEVIIDNYKEIEVEIEEFKTPEDAMDKELDRIVQRYANLNNISDRASKETDLVNIDFAGYVDGEEIKGGSSKNYVLDLAHSNFIPGFAEQLVGKNIGEEFKINVKFPEQYHDEKLQGKDAEFNIKLNGIREKVLPELNDDLARQVNPRFLTLDEMKEDIKKFLDENEKMENEKRIATKIYDMLIEKTDINIQTPMINREIQALMGEFRQRINMQGGNFDEMLERDGYEKVYDQMKVEAVQRIKTSLIIGKIAQIENVKVTQEDIQTKIYDMASLYQTTSDTIIAEIQKNPNIVNSMNQQVITEKVTKILIDSAKVSYKK